MDWSNVSLSELWSSLCEVDLNAPRPIPIFFQRFSPPKNLSKWTSRLKCNVYYYRTNYFIIFVLAFIVCFLRNPLALLATIITALGLLFLNDPFCTSTNDRLLRILRRVHARTALKLRTLTGQHENIGILWDKLNSPIMHGVVTAQVILQYQFLFAALSVRCTWVESSVAVQTQWWMCKWPCRLKHRGRKKLYILWLPQPLAVAALEVLGLTLVYLSRAWLTLAWGTLLGLGLPMLHATFRSPNLKARLASAKEEFRAVWRGYQADMMHDYTM